MRKWLTRIHFLLTYLLLFLSGALLFGACFHRLIHNEELYRESFLIGVETISILLIIPFVLLNLMLLFVLLFSRLWKRVLVAFFVSFVPLAAFILAMMIDAPTLVYRT